MCSAEVIAMEPMGYLEVVVEAALFDRPTYVVRVYERAYIIHDELALKDGPTLKYLCETHLADLSGWGLLSDPTDTLRQICAGELLGRDIVGVMPRNMRWCSKCDRPKKAKARYDPARPYKFQPLR